MVGLRNVLLLAGAAGLTAAAPTELNVRQSGASAATSPSWYPAREFFFPSIVCLGFVLFCRSIGRFFLAADMLRK